MVRRMWIELLLMGAVPASAQVDARMFRQLAVSADKIAFVYRGETVASPVFRPTAASSPTARTTTGTPTSTSSR